jgi:hypothetical protein
MDSEARIERCHLLAQQVADDPASIGALSSGERTLAALLLNRVDWLPAEHAHLLDALAWLGSEWRLAMWTVHMQRR